MCDLCQENELKKKLDGETSSLWSLLTARETTGLAAKYLQVSLELLLSQGERMHSPVLGS